MTAIRPLRIATWNLECVRPGHGARSRRIRQAITQVDADVWVLTESHPAFVPAAGYELAAISAPAPDRVAGGRWVAVWVRHGTHVEPFAVSGEPERCAAVVVRCKPAFDVVVFGTVLPWRGDRRHPDRRGSEAFERAVSAQALDWDAARASHPSAELCVAGDFNQELTADGPVGTRVGRSMLDSVLRSRELRCITAGDLDPLLSRGWRASIDHVVVSRGLLSPAAPPQIWPDCYPLPHSLPDHYGVCVSLCKSESQDASAPHSL